MQGYLAAMSENRLRSLKRRYVVIKNSEMKFYRTHKHLLRDEAPTMTLKLRDIKNISKVSLLFLPSDDSKLVACLKKC